MTDWQYTQPHAATGARRENQVLELGSTRRTRPPFIKRRTEPTRRHSSEPSASFKGGCQVQQSQRHHFQPGNSAGRVLYSVVPVRVRPDRSWAKLSERLTSSSSTRSPRGFPIRRLSQSHCPAPLSCSHFLIGKERMGKNSIPVSLES